MLVEARANGGLLETRSNGKTMASPLGAVSKYLLGSRQELKKVTWPTRKEAIRLTSLVIGISLAVAVFLGAVDFIFNFALERVLR